MTRRWSRAGALGAALALTVSVMAVLSPSAGAATEPEIRAIVDGDRTLEPGASRMFRVQVIGYQSGATWTVSGDGVTATTATAVVGGVRLSVSAAAGAAEGWRDLTLTNPDGMSDTLGDAIYVGADAGDPPSDPPPGDEPPAGDHTCDGLPATLVGTDGDDVLSGTAGDDVIVALGGNDIIDGGSGNDVICAGAGNDVITGGARDDRIFGGPGNDNMWGNDGDDILMGEAGGNMMKGGQGTDTCVVGDYGVAKQCEA